MRTISAPLLTEFARDLLVAAGVPHDESTVVATSLVGANLRGHDSHGVMRIPQYVEFVQRGEYRFGVDLEVLQETPALVVCDGHWGLGQVQAHRLLDLVIPKAQELGLPLGRSGIAVTLADSANTPSAPPDWDSCCWRRSITAEPSSASPHRAGSSPGSVQTPSARAFPPRTPTHRSSWTSGPVSSPRGRSEVITSVNVPCPKVGCWTIAANRRPTRRSCTSRRLGTILPLGGPKLTRVSDWDSFWISGPGASPAARAVTETGRRVPGNNVFFLVIDPARFAGGDYLTGEASDLAESIRTTPRSDGNNAILLPGDPERHTLADRTDHGIPLDHPHWAKLVELAGRLNVKSPD